MKAKLLMSFVVLSATFFMLGNAFPYLWKKSEITPVVLVEPNISGFTSVQGKTIGNSWTKSDVKPVVLVKPGIGGFVPIDGNSIGNNWNKDEITAVVLVEPNAEGFAPLNTTSSMLQEPSSPSLSTENQPSVIESKIDGAFNGWDDGTIVKLVNGQIWRQTQYHYEYHYAYMPKVIVVKVNGTYKMKVEGVDESVAVERLK